MLAMTPREAQTHLAAHLACQRRALSLADAQAWMTGYYVLLAVNAPRRYPSAHCLCAEVSDEHMSQEDMKRALARFAERSVDA